MPLPDVSPPTDCVLDEDEIAVIAQHEHLTADEASIRGAAMMSEPWGNAALRQMVWDALGDARRRGDDARAAALTALYRRTCLRHSNAYDRRMAPTRETHPFPPVRIV